MRGSLSTPCYGKHKYSNYLPVSERRMKPTRRWKKEKGTNIAREEGRPDRERNTNNSGWISPALHESLSWLSCCLFPEACTWAKETHLDKKRSNRDRGTQHKYTSSWGGAEERAGGETRQSTSSVSLPCPVMLLWQWHLLTDQFIWMWPLLHCSFVNHLPSSLL